MIIRNTPKGNFTFGKGKSDYLRDLDAVLGNIEGRLLSWVGDCFFSPAEGVDYNTYLDKNTEQLLIADQKRVILQSEGVIKIISYESSLDRNTRGFTAQTEISTIYGVGSLEI